MFHRPVTGVALSLVFFFAAGQVLGGTAAWELNGSLSSSTGQQALIPVGYPGVAGAPSVTFEDSEIDGRTARVARISKGTALAVLHGFPANAGGSYLNQFTVIMDARFPGLGDWISLFQTNQAYNDATAQFDLSNSNDGDWFLNPEGGVGISGNYGGMMTRDAWHRLSLVVDLAAGTLTSYIDGIQVQQLGGLGLDGRFATYTPNDPDPYDWFFLFADETAAAAEMGEVVLNSFHFHDRALTGEEIEALGGPDADGIGGPAPVAAPALNQIGAMVLVLLCLAGGFFLLGRRAAASPA